MYHKGSKPRSCSPDSLLFSETMTVSMFFVSFKSEASLCHEKTACHVHMRSPTVSSVVSPMVCAMVSAVVGPMVAQRGKGFERPQAHVWVRLDKEV